MSIRGPIGPPGPRGPQGIPGPTSVNTGPTSVNTVDTITATQSSESNPNPSMTTSLTFVNTLSIDDSPYLNNTVLAPGTSLPNDQFGSSVSISGDGNVALIAASTANNFNGSVFFYERCQDLWTEIQRIDAPVAGAGFGSSVSLNKGGNIALIGSSADDELGNNAGAVYFYEKFGTQWFLKQKLLASDGNASSAFGNSVTLNNKGDIALIGAFTDSPIGAASNGSVYMFTRTGSTWTEFDRVDSGRGGNFNFGIDLDLNKNGDIGIIAERDINQGITPPKMAYIFVKTPLSFSLSQTLIPSNSPTDPTNFGFSVSINGDGNLAVVGAFNEDTNSFNEIGAVYIFENQGTGYNEIQKLFPSNGQTGSRFGISVKINEKGDLIMVGAVNALNSSVGEVYIFKKNDSNLWEEKHRIFDSDGLSLDIFGEKIDISSDGGYGIIGARGFPNNVDPLGKAFITDLIAKGTLLNGSNSVLNKDIVLNNYEVPYHLNTSTNLIDNDGNKISELQFCQKGQITSLLWNNDLQTWIIKNEGANQVKKSTNCNVPP